MPALEASHPIIPEQTEAVNAGVGDFLGLANSSGGSSVRVLVEAPGPAAAIRRTISAIRISDRKNVSLTTPVRSATSALGFDRLEIPFPRGREVMDRINHVPSEQYRILPTANIDTQVRLTASGT